MMVNILKLLEIFYISSMFEVSPRRSAVFEWISQPPRRQMFSAFAMHDLSPKTLRPRAISGLVVLFEAFPGTGDGGANLFWAGATEVIACTHRAFQRQHVEYRFVNHLRAELA